MDNIIDNAPRKGNLVIELKPGFWKIFDIPDPTTDDRPKELIYTEQSGHPNFDIRVTATDGEIYTSKEVLLDLDYYHSKWSFEPDSKETTFEYLDIKLAKIYLDIVHGHAINIDDFVDKCQRSNKLFESQILLVIELYHFMKEENRHGVYSILKTLTGYELSLLWIQGHHHQMENELKNIIHRELSNRPWTLDYYDFARRFETASIDNLAAHWIRSVGIGGTEPIEHPDVNDKEFWNSVIGSIRSCFFNVDRFNNVFNHIRYLPDPIYQYILSKCDPYVFKKLTESSVPG